MFSRASASYGRDETRTQSTEPQRNQNQAVRSARADKNLGHYACQAVREVSKITRPGRNETVGVFTFQILSLGPQMTGPMKPHPNSDGEDHIA